MLPLSRRALIAHATALSAMATGCAPVANRVEGAGDALGDLDAAGVAARVRNGEITASEALEAAIARTERLNPQLNFIATPAYDYGRARAAAAPSGPFAGVPTLIKDLLDLEGVPTHYGSRAFANYVPRSQPRYVNTLIAAGLVPFGKSTTPEFGLTATTEPMLGGATHNPWNTSCSPGGSSGGAGAAVASRCIPIAHASDGGGSIRIPASCNGLVGLKVSRGRPVADHDDDFDLAVEGCLSRSVRDTAAWLAATERSGDRAILAPVGLVTEPNRARLRIALDIRDALGREPDAEVRAVAEAAAELCRRLGHDVREAHTPIDGDQFSADFVTLWAAGAAQQVEQIQRRAGATPLDQLLEPLTLELAQTYAGKPRGALDAAVRRLRATATPYAAMFAHADIMLTPVLAKPPLPLGEIAPTLGMAGFARVMDYVAYTPIQNVVGAPAISLPLGWSSGGLPIGVQFCAPIGGERRLLELAYELEQAQPWANRKPQVNAG